MAVAQAHRLGPVAIAGTHQTEKHANTIRRIVENQDGGTYPHQHTRREREMAQ